MVHKRSAKSSAKRRAEQMAKGYTPQHCILELRTDARWRRLWAASDCGLKTESMEPVGAGISVVQALAGRRTRRLVGQIKSKYKC